MRHKNVYKQARKLEYEDFWKTSNLMDNKAT